MESMNRLSESTECVITRYNEHINWIQYLPDYISKIYIYNKGDNENYFKNFTPSEELFSKLIVIKLPNIGRNDHTIAFHILNNWGCLPDKLVFLPGSAVMCRRKGHYLFKLVRNLPRVKHFGGFYASRYFKVTPDFDFKRETFIGGGKCNRNGNQFIKSEYSSFQSWKHSLIDDNPIQYVQYRGMFAVCKENVLSVDKQIYENILNSVSVGDNVENGHFAERIWAHLFKRN